MEEVLGQADWTDSGEDEPSLIERARFDEEAFAILYRRYADRVFRYLRTYTESEDDAADLTQHVFLRAIEALPRYQQRGFPFSTWLFRIARNAATDTYRRRQRALPWDHLPEALHPISDVTPESASVRREDLNQLRILIAGLTPEQQDLLALRFAAGLSSKEIAALVGRSPSAVKKQLTRILSRLKERYPSA